jgi:DNA-binding transcriptional ArsR family regulator
MKRTDRSTGLDFRVLHIKDGFEVIWEAMRQKPRELESRDVAVLMYVISQTNFKTGKAKITVNQISDDLAMQQPMVSHSMSRLKRAEMLVLVRDRREGCYYMPNPNLTAPVQTQRALWDVFFPHTARYQMAERAVEAESPEPADTNHLTNHPTQES